MEVISICNLPGVMPGVVPSQYHVKDVHLLGPRKRSCQGGRLSLLVLASGWCVCGRVTNCSAHSP